MPRNFVFVAVSSVEIWKKGKLDIQTIVKRESMFLIMNQKKT